MLPPRTWVRSKGSLLKMSESKGHRNRVPALPASKAYGEERSFPMINLSVPRAKFTISNQQWAARVKTTCLCLKMVNRLVGADP